MKDIEKKITKLYNEATKEAAKVGVSTPHFNPDKPFDSKNYPSVTKKLDEIVETLATNIQVTVENGITEQWDIANSDNNEMCHLALGNTVDSMTGEQLSKYFNNHEEALAAFQSRKVSGMGLSDRVWNIAGQFQEQIEMAIDLGLRDGVSAARMSTTLKQYLNDPDKLFRRVRDEHGVLRLSKAAKSYHPGQGRYRSSHKNALRLARTEVNMAYRTADHLRIQDFDFVVGIEVHRSQNLYPCPVCESLKGKYPKDFKFVGWHPQCRCFTTTILKTQSEVDEDNERIMRGEEPSSTSKNSITKTPDNFNSWVKDNSQRIERAEKKGTLSYFLKDNKGYVDNAMKGAPVKKGKTIFKTEAQKKALQERWDARKAANIKAAQSAYDDTWELLQEEKFDDKIKYLTEANDAETNPLVKSLYADKLNSLNSIKQAQIKRHANRDTVAIQKAWSERSAIDNYARRIHSYMSGISDVDTSKLSQLMARADRKATLKEAYVLRDQGKEILALKHLDDPMGVARQFSKAEAMAVDKGINTTIESWTAKYGYKSWDIAPLEHKKGKLEHEIALISTSKKYETWEVAKKYYEKELEKTDTLLEWQEFSSKGVILKGYKTKSSIYKALCKDFDNAIATKNKTAANKVLNELEKKYKQLEFAKKKIAKENKSKQLSHIQRKLSSRERIEQIKKATGVDEAKAKEFNDAVASFTYEWDYEIRQWHCGNNNIVSKYGHAIDDIKKKAEDLEEFIKLSPKWEGSITYRGMSLSPREIDKLRTDLISGNGDMLGAASWSTKSGVSENFSRYHIGEISPEFADLKDTKVVLVSKKQNNGTSIMHLSHFSSEYEVLVSKETRYKYISEYKQGDYLFIEVEPK